MRYTYKPTLSGNPKYSVWDHNNHLAGYTNTKGLIEHDECGHLLSRPIKIFKEENDLMQELKSSEIF